MTMSKRFTAKDIIEDPCCSYWLRNAITAALQRDPVDAAHDAALLLEVLDQRARKLFAE